MTDTIRLLRLSHLNNIHEQMAQLHKMARQIKDSLAIDCHHEETFDVKNDNVQFLVCTFCHLRFEATPTIPACVCAP